MIPGASRIIGVPERYVRRLFEIDFGGVAERVEDAGGKEKARN